MNLQWVLKMIRSLSISQCCSFTQSALIMLIFFKYITLQHNVAHTVFINVRYILNHWSCSNSRVYIKSAELWTSRYDQHQRDFSLVFDCTLHLSPHSRALHEQLACMIFYACREAFFEISFIFFPRFQSAVIVCLFLRTDLSVHIFQNLLTAFFKISWLLFQNHIASFHFIPVTYISTVLLLL